MLETCKIKKEVERLRLNGDISKYAESSLLAEVRTLDNQSTHSWVKYSWKNPMSYPTAY